MSFISRRNHLPPPEALTLRVFTAGLRAQLLLLVLFAVLPAIGLITHSALSAREQAAVGAETAALNLVHLIAREQHRLIEGTRQLLISLVKLPEIRRPVSVEACHQTLAGVVKPFSYYRNIGLAMLDGTVLCRSMNTKTRDVNVADRGYFQRALQTRDFGIGDYQIGRSTHKNSVNFGQAVLDDKGNITAVLHVALDLTWLNQLIASYELTPGTVLTIVDSLGTVLASAPDFATPVGTSIRDSDLFKTLVTYDKAATAKIKGPDGEERLYAFAPLHRSPNGVVYIVASVSQTVVFAQANKELMRNLAFLALVAILAFGAAWTGSEVFILRRMRSLEADIQHKAEELTRAKDEIEMASQAKSRFFAAASHDLRQPLHALSLFAGSLQLNAKQMDLLPTIGKMQAALGSLEFLFEEILDIAALESGNISVRLETVSISSVFEKLEREFKPLADAKNLQLRLRASPALLLETDILLLERILRNLIANAIKYTARGGILVAFRPSNDGSTAKIQVFDTGMGIAATELSHIFEDFYQLSPAVTGQHKGVGLGLGIVKRLANLLHAPIEVRSQPGRGSVFTLQVLLSAKKEMALPKAVETNSALSLSLAGRSILVVDDDESVVSAIRTLLLDWGARVSSATSKTELQHTLEELAIPPDFLIVDYQFEPSWTGEDVIGQIRQHFRSPIPCAMMTGNVSLIPQHVFQFDRVHIFSKPVNPAKLRALLHFNLLLSGQVALTTHALRNK